MKKKIKILSIVILIMYSFSIHCQETEENKTYSVSSSIIIDNVSNFSGGIETGNSTLGLFDFGIDYAPFHT